MGARARALPAALEAATSLAADGERSAAALLRAAGPAALAMPLVAPVIVRFAKSRCCPRR